MTGKSEQAKTYSQSPVFIWAAVAQILALVVAVIALYREISMVKSGVGHVTQRMQQVESDLKNLGFTITYPLNGGTVSLTDVVQGSSPYPDTNHYLIVTPIRNGENFVQSKAISVSPDGSWSTTAEFGQGAVGDGQKFGIRIISTRSTLGPGRLESFPADAKVTNSIVVTRQDEQ